MGHARALLGLPQPALMKRLWKKIVSEGLSVRQTEAEVKDLMRPAEGEPAKPIPTPKKIASTKPAFLNQVEVDLLSRLNTKVRIKPRDNDTGTIEISYYSQDDLERILDLILGRQEHEQE